MESGKLSKCQMSKLVQTKLVFGIWIAVMLVDDFEVLREDSQSEGILSRVDIHVIIYFPLIVCLCDCRECWINRVFASEATKEHVTSQYDGHYGESGRIAWLHFFFL